MSFMELAFDRKDTEEIVFQGMIVMSTTETEYLRQLISQFQGIVFGKVLEVGYGLGVSFGLIQESLRPRMHHVIEIEKSIFFDCEAQCKAARNAEAFLGDFYDFDFRCNYDFVFCDPFDYLLEGGNDVSNGCANDAALMVSRARSLLSEGGVLCYPYFGDLEMPRHDGMTLHEMACYIGPPFRLWDGSMCERGMIGYYKLPERGSSGSPKFDS